MQNSVEEILKEAGDMALSMQSEGIARISKGEKDFGGGKIVWSVDRMEVIFSRGERLNQEILGLIKI